MRVKHRSDLESEIGLKYLGLHCFKVNPATAQNSNKKGIYYRINFVTYTSYTCDEIYVTAANCSDKTFDSIGLHILCISSIG